MGVTLILGLGATGLALAEYMQHRGRQLLVVDTRASPPMLGRLRQLAPGAQFMPAGQCNPQQAGVEAVYVSPGFPLAHPLLEQLAQLGLTLDNDINLFASQCTGRIAAVTGTNGKSTVCSMLAHCLTASTASTRLGGNIGTGVVHLLDEDAADYYVLELSSFQLRYTSRLHGHSGCLLNLAADHLDQYACLENYAADKQRIYTFSAAQICNLDNPASYPASFGNQTHLPAGSTCQPNLWWFGFGQHPHANWQGDFDQTRLATTRGNWLCLGNRQLLPVDRLPNPLAHNQANALACIALLASLDCVDAASHLASFTCLPHRCQLLGTRQGRVFINDSKATNPHAAIGTLRSLGCTHPGLVVIAGGDAKGIELTGLGRELADSARQVVLLGKDKEALAAACCAAGLHPILADSLDDAFTLALAKSRCGECIALCPGCASTDMFCNYQDRGDQFMQLVQAL